MRICLMTRSVRPLSASALSSVLRASRARSRCNSRDADANMARKKRGKAGKKNTPKLRKASPTPVSGAAEMKGAASAAFAGDSELVTPSPPQVYVVKVRPSLAEQLAKQPLKSSRLEPPPDNKTEQPARSPKQPKKDRFKPK